MINIICLGWLFSILYSQFILPNTSGDIPKFSPTVYPFLYQGMIMIPISSHKALHIHHWIIYASICLLRFWIGIPNLFLGFSLGLTFQGLQYSDRFQCICPNPYQVMTV